MKKTNQHDNIPTAGDHFSWRRNRKMDFFLLSFQHIDSGAR